MEMNSSNENKFQKQEANKFAIAALALGILGLLIAFLSSQGGGKLNLAIGILAAASLIAMLMNLKSKIKSENSVKSSDFNFGAGIKTTVDGTAAFYFAVILFLLAGFFSYLKAKNKQPV